MPLRVRPIEAVHLWMLVVCLGTAMCLPLQLLLAFPEEHAPHMSRGFRRILAEAGAEDMRASPLFVSNNTLLVMRSMCDAIQKYNPVVLLAFLPPPRAFFASLATGQSEIPIISLSREYTDVAAKEMNPWHLSLDPHPRDLGDAIFHFLCSQDWYQVTLLLDGDSRFSEAVSRRLLSLSTGHPPMVQVIRLPSSRDQSMDLMNSRQTSPRRVLLLCCTGPIAQRTLQVARDLGMLDGDWNWILLEDASLVSDLDELPPGILGIKLRRQVTTRHSVRAAVEIVAESARYLDSNLWLRIQGNKSEISCWDAPEEQRTRLSSALHTVIRHQLERESPVSREGLEPPVFDIFNLVSSASQRRRWKRLGNVTGSRVSMDTVVWMRPSRTEFAPSHVMRRFRVVTSFSPPFVKPGTRISNGTCLIGVPCLQVQTNDRHRIAAIFADYNAGRSEGVTYNVSCCAGVSIDLLLSLSRDLKFDFDLYLVADGLFGTLRGSRWNGITADLVSGAAHMTLAAFSITSVRQKVIDFSVPYFHSGVSCLTSSQYREVPLSAFLVPFSIQLWVAIFAGLTATAIAAAIYEWLSPFGLNPWGRQRTKNFSLASALWVMWSLLFSHLVAFKAPKSWPNKVLINIWGCFSVIFLASYTANIAALFAGLFFHLRVEDFRDASLLTLKTGTARGSAAESYVFAENSKLWQHIQKYGVDTLQEGLAKLRKKELDVLIGDTAILNYYRGNDPGCNLHLLGDSIFDVAYAVGLQKEFLLKDAISESLLRYNEYGYLDQLQKKWYGRVPCFDDRLHRFNQPEPLSIEAVAGVFIMLVVGVFVGFIILILEHLVFKYALPILRKKPKECVWRSPNLMFFSQKLYRFINTVELVSPHHSAKEIVSNLREGQIASLFQKSVKKKFQEEARRRKSKSQFFDMIQEIRRVVRQQNEPRLPTWEDSRQQLTSPPESREVVEADNLFREQIDEEDGDGDDDDDSVSQTLQSFHFIPQRHPTATDAMRGRMVGPCRYSSVPSNEFISPLESYQSSSSEVTFCKMMFKSHLSSSTGDLSTVKFKENMRLNVEMIQGPRVRSLDDLRGLRKSSVEDGGTHRKVVRADIDCQWSAAVDDLRLYSMTKEDILRVWQKHERVLLNRLKDTLREKRILEEKLAFIQKTLLKPP